MKRVNNFMFSADYSNEVHIDIGKYRFTIPEENMNGNKTFVRVDIPSIDMKMNLSVGSMISDNKVEILKSEYPWKELKSQ